MNAQNEHRPARTELTAIALICLCLISNSNAAAETSSQRFGVFVPARAEIVAPAPLVTADASGEGEQSLPTQSWQLASTSSSGMMAEFAVARAFTNPDQPGAKSDASLSVRVGKRAGLGRWESRVARDVTNHAAGDERASVQVTSTSSGRASVDLQVGISDADQLPTGRYSTTVVMHDRHTLELLHSESIVTKKIDIHVSTYARLAFL